jgi:hypothetical protein
MADHQRWMRRCKGCGWQSRPLYLNKRAAEGIAGSGELEKPTCPVCGKSEFEAVPRRS